MKKQIFYQEKMKKRKALFSKLLNELNEQIQSFIIKLNSLDSPTSPIMFLRNLNLIISKKNLGNIKKAPSKNMKNPVSSEPNAIRFIKILNFLNINNELKF